MTEKIERDRRTEVVQVKLTQAEYAYLEQLAVGNGDTMAGYLRRVALYPKGVQR